MPSTRVAFVTGAARGIGRAIALQLADDGLDVAVNDLRSTPELDEVVTLIEKKGRRSIALSGDVSSEAEVEKLIQDVVRRLGGVDVMVANAGIAVWGSLFQTTVEDFDRMMAVNARGTMLCYKHAAKQMISQGRGGRIIGAASVASKQGSDAVSMYSASKFAVRGLTQAAAREFGKYGITVNAYAPGAIDTPMLQGFNDLAGNPDAANGATKTPISRLGTPEDIAGLVSYLASERSSFVTGQSISINGGSFFD
ncbi:NAD-binding protein [Gloeopeniophorella convolvens]|nr:NAD-binding protein [Gloeopeniophorella convolvens]